MADDDSPFISVQDLSDWLGRDVTADPGATVAVDAACSIVRGFSDQTFNQNTSTVVLDGTGTDCLLLRELPVTAAGTVVENGVALVASSDYLLADGGKLVRLGGAGTALPYSTYLPMGSGAVWRAGRQNVVVTYTHGWPLTPTNDVPRDVRYVALALAQRMIVQGPASGESVGGQSVSFTGPAGDLTAGERMVLEKYRPRA